MARPSGTPVRPASEPHQGAVSTATTSAPMGVAPTAATYMTRPPAPTLGASSSSSASKMRLFSATLYLPPLTDLSTTPTVPGSTTPPGPRHSTRDPGLNRSPALAAGMLADVSAAAGCTGARGGAGRSSKDSSEVPAGPELGGAGRSATLSPPYPVPRGAEGRSGRSSVEPTNGAPGGGVGRCCTS